jgi:cytochrome c oxidase subunit II
MNDLLRRLLGLPPQASTYARGIDTLHYFVIASTMLGATLVFVLAIYFLVRYRQRAPSALTPRDELGAPGEFFIIASLQMLFLVFWAVGAWQYDHLMTPPADAMPVYVTAKQWMWKFAYPDGFASMDVLTVPAKKPIKLVMTSRDVIHSFYVPAFRMKHDVVPGRYYTAWFTAEAPGLYDIDCAEYCGPSHSAMLGKVRVLSDEEYRKWLEGRPRAAGDRLAGTSTTEDGDLAAEGVGVASRRGCLNCHTIDGQRHIGPSFAGLYESSVRLTDGRTLLADEAYLTRSMMDPDIEVVAGYQAIMPNYRGVLPEPEVAALVEFIKSIRDRPVSPSMSLPKVVPAAPAQPGEPSR